VKLLQQFWSYFAVVCFLSAFGLLRVAGALGADAKCEHCKAPSRIAQLLGANQSLASTNITSAASDKQSTAPAASARPEMLWIPGGEFLMGAATNGHGNSEMPMASNDAEPVHRVFVDGFWMDTTTVTNEQFEKFVRATGYVTIAEHTPTKEEFPTAPAENLVAGSVVFAPTDQ